jgi:hypothetical protein
MTTKSLHALGLALFGAVALSGAAAKAELVTTSYVPTYYTTYAAPVAYYPNAVYPVAVNGRYAAPVVFSVPMDMPRGSNTRILDTRFGDVSVMGEQRAGFHHYVIAINGMPLLSAMYQTDRMQVSQVYKLVDEDVMIFTIDGKVPGCKVRNFLMSLRSNGTFVGPTEIGDCRMGYQARLYDNGLLVEFPDEYRKDNLSSWRYKYGAMERL